MLLEVLTRPADFGMLVLGNASRRSLGTTMKSWMLVSIPLATSLLVLQQMERQEFTTCLLERVQECFQVTLVRSQR